MIGDIKNFHESEMKCSAIVTDWAHINVMNHHSENFFEFMGNYMDDDSDTVYAMFKDVDHDKKYVIEID